LTITPCLNLVEFASPASDNLQQVSLEAQLVHYALHMPTGRKCATAMSVADRKPRSLYFTFLTESNKERFYTNEFDLDTI